MNEENINQNLLIESLTFLLSSLILKTTEEPLCGMSLQVNMLVIPDRHAT